MFIDSAIKKKYPGLITQEQSSVFLPVSPSLRTALEDYLHWKSSYAPTATQRYRNRLEPFISYLNPDTLASTVSIDNVIAYHEQMKRAGYNPMTLKYSCVIIKNFFSFLRGRGVCTLNPMEIKAMKCSSPVKDPISEDEFRLMNDSLDERFFSELVRKLVINLLWDTGMRVSELCDLNIGDIQNTRNPEIRCTRIQRRKSKRYNIVYWGKETNRLLNIYLGLRLSLDIETDALLIAGTTRLTKITTRSVQRWVKEIAEKAGIDRNVSPHDYRHTKAHKVLNKSENIRDVQCLLGHVTPLSSFHYVGLNIERQLQISEKYL